MPLNTARENEVLIARPEGRIDALNAREFQSELSAAIDDEAGAVLLDLEDLSYISSAGLRVILLVAKDLRKRDAKLALCSLQAPIREVFETSGFDQILALHASRAEALAALRG